MDVETNSVILTHCYCTLITTSTSIMCFHVLVMWKFTNWNALPKHTRTSTHNKDSKNELNLTIYIYIYYLHMMLLIVFVFSVGLDAKSRMLYSKPKNLSLWNYGNHPSSLTMIRSWYCLMLVQTSLETRVSVEPAAKNQGVHNSNHSELLNASWVPGEYFNLRTKCFSYLILYI